MRYILSMLLPPKTYIVVGENRYSSLPIFFIYPRNNPPLRLLTLYVPIIHEEIAERGFHIYPTRSSLSPYTPYPEVIPRCDIFSPHTVFVFKESPPLLYDA